MKISIKGRRLVHSPYFLKVRIFLFLLIFLIVLINIFASSENQIVEDINEYIFLSSEEINNTLDLHDLNSILKATYTKNNNQYVVNIFKFNSQDALIRTIEERVEPFDKKK